MLIFAYKELMKAYRFKVFLPANVRTLRTITKMVGLNVEGKALNDIFHQLIAYF